jgi:hypothetical protein
MGPPDQEGLRGGSLGRQQVEDLREPLELPSLSQTHESHHRDHQLRAGPQHPATPHQERHATPRPGSRLPELIPSPCPPGGSLSFRLPRTGQRSALSSPLHPAASSLLIMSLSTYVLRHPPPLATSVRGRAGAPLLPSGPRPSYSRQYDVTSALERPWISQETGYHNSRLNGGHDGKRTVRRSGCP